MTATLPNINAPNVDPITVPLDAILLRTQFLVPPGTPVFTLLFDVPAGVTIRLMLNQNYPWQLDVGQSSYLMAIDGCPYLGGLSFETDLAYPGESVKMFVGAGVRTS